MKTGFDCWRVGSRRLATRNAKSSIGTFEVECGRLCPTIQNSTMIPRLEQKREANVDHPRHFKCRGMSRFGGLTGKAARKARTSPEVVEARSLVHRLTLTLDPRQTQAKRERMHAHASARQDMNSCPFRKDGARRESTSPVGFGTLAGPGR